MIDFSKPLSRPLVRCELLELGSDYTDPEDGDEFLVQLLIPVHISDLVKSQGKRSGFFELLASKAFVNRVVSHPVINVEGCLGNTIFFLTEWNYRQVLSQMLLPARKNDANRLRFSVVMPFDAEIQIVNEAVGFEPSSVKGHRTQIEVIYDLPDKEHADIVGTRLMKFRDVVTACKILQD